MLELATIAGRILVTRDGEDFIRLAQAWGEAGQSHAGILVIWGRRRTAFGEIVAALHETLVADPDHAA